VRVDGECSCSLVDGIVHTTLCLEKTMIDALLSVLFEILSKWILLWSQ